MCFWEALFVFDMLLCVIFVFYRICFWLALVSVISGFESHPDIMFVVERSFLPHRCSWWTSLYFSSEVSLLYSFSEGLFCVIFVLGECSFCHTCCQKTINFFVLNKKQQHFLQLSLWENLLLVRIGFCNTFFPCKHFIKLLCMWLQHHILRGGFWYLPSAVVPAIYAQWCLCLTFAANLSLAQWRQFHWAICLLITWH